MAEMQVTLNGVLFPKTRSDSDQPVPVTFVGSAWYTGLSVGGGPIFPDTPPVGGPPGQPIHPIWGPPGIDFPDKPGYPPTVGGGPIIPPEAPPEVPPDTPPSSVVKDAPVGGWGYYTDADNVAYAAFRSARQPKG